MTKKIDRAFEEAIVSGVFPAADVLVAKNGEVAFEAAYGNARKGTCFDIASLTKPFSTAALAMTLVAEKLLTLDDTVYQWLAGARRPEHKEITAKLLLEHTSGLPAWQPYFRELPMSMIGTEAGKRIILDNCYNEMLVAKPGSKTIYSDIGYIILGEMIEQAGGAKLDELFDMHIAKPLKLEDTFFNRIIGAPIQTSKKKTDSSSHHKRIAPTEDCPWRERVIRGEVHDQNAYALGGVAGHAGLFSTAGDLHTLTKELVACWRGNGSLVPTAVAKEFMKVGDKKPEGDAFTLGWMRPSRKNSSSGHFFSPQSIGHLGYTGCSIWIDLAKDFWIILLTNRVHPSSTNEKIKTFRPKIHDLIFEEIISD